MLIGRDRELGEIAALLGEARRGRSGMLAIVGEAGVGKTALLEEARRQAADMRLLTATGVETESELPYAALHELLRPLLELLSRIPVTQARAVAAALALEEGKPDTLAVNAGTMSLLAEAAEGAPVLVVLDDAQWLDSPSAEALVFAARRLRLERIAVLAAFRPASAVSFEPLPRLDLEPLAHDDARLLLKTRPKPVALSDEARVLAAAAGNPLALLELPVELAQDLPAAGSSLTRLERAFAQRVDAMPPDTRLGLLLAAAEPDPATVRRASDLQHLDDPLGPAEAAGLVLVRDGALAFRHPVVRSLVYATAPASDRGAAHRALAEALPDDADADRRAWHLAAAADGPDAVVATLLEQTAERAIARGGHAAAARALERAARLTPIGAERARRLSSAFHSQRWSGDATKAVALAEEALSLTDDPLLRADLRFQLRSMGEWGGARASEAELLRDLEEVDGLGDERSAKVLILVVMHRAAEWDAAGAAALTPRLERYGRGAGPVWEPRVKASAAIAYLLAGDRARAERLFAELAGQVALPTMAAFEFMSLEWYEELRQSLAETLRGARAEGNLHRIAWNRTCAAHLELRFGRLHAAEVAAAEAIPLGEVLVNPKMDLAAAALAGVQAWRGQADSCLANARRAAASARAATDRFAEGLAHMPLGLLALGAGRPGEAIVELEPLARRWTESTVADPAAVPFVPDLVEAYALSGSTGEARELLERFTSVAGASGNTLTLAGSHRCRGLLAPVDEFDPEFSSALELLEGSPYALELARTRLAYGERLRRARRQREARPQLQTAFEAFAAVGATPWQERTAAELRAAGVKVDSTRRAQVDLTPQELHIASLVAEGKTNKEIAASMYLSPKTVGYHLANAYRKLDIHSRAELTRLVSQEATVGADPA